MPVPTSTSSCNNLGNSKQGNPAISCIPTMEFSASGQAASAIYGTLQQELVGTKYTSFLPAQNMIMVQVNAGETFTIQAENSTKCIAGPAQVPMLSPDGAIPPIHVPPGYGAQVIQDNGVRRVLVRRLGAVYHGMADGSLIPHTAFVHNIANFIPCPTMMDGSTASISGFVPTQQKYDRNDITGTSQTPPFQYQSLPDGLKTSVYTSTSENCASVSSGSSFCTTPSPTDSPDSSPRISGSQHTISKRNTKQHSVGTSPLHHKEHQSSLTFRKSTTMKNSSHKPSHEYVFTPSQRLNSNSLCLESTRFVAAPEVGGVTSETVITQGDQEKTLYEILSSVSKPMVTDLQSRSALLEWPAICDLEDIQVKVQYKLFVESSKLNHIYDTADMRFELLNLKPAVSYTVRVQACVGVVAGILSDSTTFVTKPSIPDTPSLPKLNQKTKTSLTLKWTPPQDNGSKIVKYHLEWDGGDRGSGFRTLYMGNQRQQKFNKLIPGTEYTFRMQVHNSIGHSPCSPEVTYATCDAPPPTPDPPVCLKFGVNQLILTWKPIQSKTPVYYSLEMDAMNEYGFRPIYDNEYNSYTVNDLERNKEYCFRLRCYNRDNYSGYSDVVKLATLPGRPQSPGKPHIVGKPQPTHLRVGWAPPKDSGGSVILSYQLEANKDRTSQMKVVYTGPDTECLFTDALPGHSYKFQVSCSGPAGDSPMSDIAVLTTPPIQPGPCSPPLLGSKPKSTSLLLVWDHPSNDGGSKISLFEVKYRRTDEPSSDMIEIYKGVDSKCSVGSLKPGTKYSFTLRAFNKVGHGPWSEITELTTGAGAPETPTVPEIVEIRATYFFMQWEEPANNGSDIIHYNVEWGHSHGSMNVTQVSECQFKMDGLIPNTMYYYRLQAVNGAGQGSYSEVGTAQTKPSTPGRVKKVTEMSEEVAESYLSRELVDESSIDIANEDVKLYQQTNMIGLQWIEPQDNGSEITNYIINMKSESNVLPPINLTMDELGVEEDSATETSISLLRYVLMNLDADTEYSVSINACNAIGQGLGSDWLTVKTHPLPPPPPLLDCVSANYNGFKLTWMDQSKHCTSYLLQMQESGSSRWTTKYHGPNRKYQVGRLSDLTTYNFRINSRNNAGEGAFSKVYSFKTTEAPLPVLSEPRVELNETCATISWAEASSRRDCEASYKLCVHRVSDNANMVDIHCDGTKYRLTELTIGETYVAMVAVVLKLSRHRNNSGDTLEESTNEELKTTSERIGAFSQPCTFHIPSESSITDNSDDGSELIEDNKSSNFLVNLFQRFSEDLSDETKSFVLLLIFAVISVILTVLLQTLVL